MFIRRIGKVVLHLHTRIRDDWNEADHPRQPAGGPQGGEFTAGGGQSAGAGVPAPPPHQQHVKVPGNKIKAIAESITGKSDLEEAAAHIKNIASQYLHSAISTYANQVLGHLEHAHGLAPGALGKAFKAKKGATPAPAPAPAPAAPQPAPEPAAAAEPEDDGTAPATGGDDLDPEPGNGFQNLVYGLATIGKNSPGQKAKNIIQTLNGAPAASAANQAFAQAWIKKLEGSQAEISKSWETPATPKPDPDKLSPETIMATIFNNKTASVESKIAALEKVTSSSATLQQHKLQAATYIKALKHTQSVEKADKYNEEIGAKQVENIEGWGNSSQIKHEVKIKLIEGVTPQSESAKNVQEAWLKKLKAPPEPVEVKGPDPYPGSKPQAELHKIATDPNTSPQDKIDALANHPVVQAYPTANSATFSAQWQQAIAQAHGLQVPQKAATPAAAKPAAAPAKPTLAQQAAAAAPKVPKHGSLTAPANAQVTQARKGPQLAFALKAEADSAKPESTTSAESSEIVPSLKPQFWSDTQKKDQAAFSSYGGGGYQDINGVLRGHVKNFDKSTLDKIDAMHAIMESPEVKIAGDKPLKLVRGEHVSDEQLHQIKTDLEKGIGTVPYLRTGFTSASIGSTPGYQSQAKTWWHFTVMPGAKVLGLAGNVGHHEREVVLPHGVSTEIYEMYHDGKRNIIKAIVR